MEVATLILVIIILLLVYSTNNQSPKENYARASYFNGGVAVEYQQTRQFDRDDFVTFRFYEPGYYQVRFATFKTSDRQSGNKTPTNFDTTVTTFTREIVIKQRVMADYLTITIVSQNGQESHDFR